MIIRPMFHRLARVAAVILIVLSTVLIYQQYTGDGFTPGLVYDSEQTNGVYGLDDGSHIYLDQASQLVLDQAYNDETRTMRLEDGKGFFVVKPDKDKAFEVVTDHLTAIVKGTTFLVRTDDHSASVGVNTGVVEVHVGNQTVTLRAGDQIDYSDEKGGVVTRSVFNKEEFEALQAKSLNYHNTPLKVVLNDLREIKGINIVVPESVMAQRFTLSLEEANTIEIVKTIAVAAGLQFKKENENYILFAN